MSIKNDYKKRRRPNNNGLRLLLSNLAVAVLIVLVVLAGRFVVQGLTKQRQAKNQKQEAKVEKTVEPTSTPEPTPTATPEPQGSERWIRKDLDATSPMVALTFDDGPYGPVDKRLIAVLEKYNARATFFVVGNRVDQFSESLKNLYQHGHQIGSHTYSHENLSELSAAKIKKQLNKADKKIAKYIGCSSTCLRPPYGSVNDTMRSVIKVPMIYWTVDSEDWKDRNKMSRTKKANQIRRRCKEVRDGDIVLFHDLYDSTADAIEKIVPQLVQDGFTLVTVDELFYYKNIDAKGGKVYFSGR